MSIALRRPHGCITRLADWYSGGLKWNKGGAWGKVEWATMKGEQWTEWSDLQ